MATLTSTDNSFSSALLYPFFSPGLNVMGSFRQLVPSSVGCLLQCLVVAQGPEGNGPSPHHGAAGSFLSPAAWAVNGPGTEKEVQGGWIEINCMWVPGGIGFFVYFSPKLFYIISTTKVAWSCCFAYEFPVIIKHLFTLLYLKEISSRIL